MSLGERLPNRWFKVITAMMLQSGPYICCQDDFIYFKSRRKKTYMDRIVKIKVHEQNFQPSNYSKNL